MSDLVKRLESVEFMGLPDGRLDYSTATEAAARIEALEARITKADALAAWAKAISERKPSPVTGGRLILERDILGLEKALADYREGSDT